MRLQTWKQFEDRVFTSRRVALYAIVLPIGYLAFIVRGYAGQYWLFNTDGSARTLDFVPIWTAARLAFTGAAVSAYDFAAFTRAQLDGTGRLGGDYTWAYPPTYFFLLLPLALFSYATAAVLWLSATGLAYVAAMRAILPRTATVCAALASPFVLWNIISGQNGFLTAALIGGALILLDRRPIAAGILLGLLTVKPQFGVLFPIVLILTGRWQVFAAATVTALLLALLSALAFGLESWTAFFASMQNQAGTVLVQGSVGFQKQQTVYAMVRLLGGGASLAWLLHIGVAAAAAVFACRLWLQPVDGRLKAAALVAAALLATPYLFIYDLPILTVPLVFLASLGIAEGFIPGERTAMVALVAILLLLPGKPVGLPLLLLLMLLIVLRLRLRPKPSL